MAEHLLTNASILLAIALVVAFVLHRLNAPTFVGYIFAGVLVGPGGLHLLYEGPGLELLAEVGIAFLMFYVGLEFSLPVLAKARRAVFVLGGLEVLLVGAVAGAVAFLLGVSLLASIVVGGAVAMSSTAICIRQLADQEELKTDHGKIAVGTLLFQDLATLPFLILISTLALRDIGGSLEGAALGPVLIELGRALGIGGLAFLIVAGLGRYILVQAVAAIAATGSRELFMLAILLLVLAAGSGAHAAGLSLPLGAFLAGMILGETRFKHDAEEAVQPFRDVLLGLFFVTVGMRLEMTTLLEAWPQVLAIVAALVLGKGLLIYALLRVLGDGHAPATRAAVILAHGGEFGLLLITLALGAAVLPSEIGQPLIAAVAISMIAAPFLIGAASRLTDALTRPRAGKTI